MPIAMQYGASGRGNAGGLTMDLLWENSAPSSNFAAQNVSVNLSAYKMFGIVMWYSTTTQDETPMNMYTVDEAPKYLMISGSNNRGGARVVTYDGTNGALSFADATYNSGTNNAYLIPLRIYGIR
ncbi:MAG: hypothetical protein IKE76_02955 [Clostridia bacterium]|nr:hypothetical protein [Clostridia bacterium]